MNYQTWESAVQQEIKEDAVWKIKAYRVGLFLSDIAWQDVTRLVQDRRTLRLSDQLYRAVGSISANIAEGYSRRSSAEKARFYEYSLGSARESRDWYFKARHILGPEASQHRIQMTTQIIRLLLTMIPNMRSRSINEAADDYQAFAETNTPSLEQLLNHVPQPPD